jgi:phage shock protein C
MKKKFSHSIRMLVEQRIFGVCTRLGNFLNMSESRIRVYFIYISFLTFGSPILLYLFIAFWLEVKDQFTRSRRSVWDL